MTRLSRTSLEIALAFAAEAGVAAREAERADRWLLERIAKAVDCDLATYAHHPDAFRARPDPDTNLPWRSPWAPSVRDWEVIEAEHPFCRYVAMTGEQFGAALRLSDVVDMDAFRRTEYFERFGDPGMPHKVEIRFPSEGGAYWSVDLERGGRDFGPQETRLLAALRPALSAYEAYRSLAARTDALLAAAQDGTSDGRLTYREREVLDLVAEGASNAAIAERLYISAGTVKKHLENIYAKLEVGSRTAALARTGRSGMVEAPTVH